MTLEALRKALDATDVNDRQERLRLCAAIDAHILRAERERLEELMGRFNYGRQLAQAEREAK